MAEPETPSDRMIREVGEKQDRMLRARTAETGFWGSFQVLGMVGWSVTLPTLLGIALGRLSWTGAGRSAFRGRSCCCSRGLCSDAPTPGFTSREKTGNHEPDPSFRVRNAARDLLLSAGFWSPCAISRPPAIPLC